jgi:tRNA modification GTPase
MRRARSEVERADLVLAVLDASVDADAQRAALAPELATAPQVLWLYNKSDLANAAAPAGDDRSLAISARDGSGLAMLRTRLRDAAGLGEGAAGAFSARARHVDALHRVAHHLADARCRLVNERAGELAAEDLRLAQDELAALTGTLGSDALLGRIFSSFCIGK